MKTSITAAFIAATLLAYTSTTSAQAGPRPPPITGQTVNLMYSNAGNDELGSDDVPFNSCFPSVNAFAPFAYLTFAPKNATINFYKDSNCQEFTFGLDGYYGGYPGQARSFRWVGWSEEALGELFLKPIPGQGEAAIHPGGPAPVTPPTSPVPPTEGGPKNPPPLTTTPDQQTGGGGNGTNYKTSTSFIGGVLGSLVVLSIGGLIFWKTTSKKKEDKGKGLLPYSRAATREDDGDILLTTHNRSHLNNDETSFSIGGDDDEESDDDEEDRRHARRQIGPNDEDEEEEELREQKHARPGQHDHYRDDGDHA